MHVSKSKFLLSEDYWAIWLGGFLLTIGLVGYVIWPYPEIFTTQRRLKAETEQATQLPFPTVASIESAEALRQIAPTNSFTQRVQLLLQTPLRWEYNPWKSFFKTEPTPPSTLSDSVAALRAHALHLQQLAESSAYQDQQLNQSAAEATTAWLAGRRMLPKAAHHSTTLPITLPLLGLVLALIFGVGAHFMGHGFRQFVVGFLVVFVLAVLAQVLGQQADFHTMGLGYAWWAIAIGLLISNTLGTPQWLKPALQTEFFVKTGLVILGAEILISKVLAIGLPGIFVAWVVTPIVLVCTFWFGQRVLKITSKSLNITVSADMSVCGVSAAIATAAASKATKEELTIAVGLSMVFTSVMMVVMPAFIRAVGMPEVLGGAWLGGTLDATGAVVAAGAFLGDTALQVAATIKMIQNMLIGLIAFGVAYYFSTRVEGAGKSEVRLREIWDRFPKFILGFIGASLLCSLIYTLSGPALGEALISRGLVRGFTKDLHGWLFSLAFVCIGLSVNFKALKHHFSGGKPLILYACGQAFNLILTLLMAWVMFYLVFPEITESLTP